MDWADGMNWSRYYNIRSSNYGDRPLSLGRVQTATLALLVDRDEAIARFVPSAYFELKATMNLPEGQLDLFHRPSADHRITDKAVAADIASRQRDVPTNLEVDKKPTPSSHHQPYSLPEPKRAASARCSRSTKKTLHCRQI